MIESMLKLTELILYSKKLKNFLSEFEKILIPTEILEEKRGRIDRILAGTW